MYIPIQMDDGLILQSLHLWVTGFLCHCGCLMWMAQPVTMVMVVRSVRAKGFLLSFWLCDVDGTASGDDAGCAFICNNKNIIIINNKIINDYMYVEVH